MYKKFLAGALTAIMAFSLVACGSSDDKDKKSEQETVTTAEGATTGKYKASGDEMEVEYGVVKLADVKDVVVYEDDIKVTEESYKSQTDSILSQYTTQKTVKKGKVKKDSSVVVDYSGQIEVDGKKVTFDKGTAQDQTINVGTDTSNYIDGFVSCLVGRKVGDKFTKKLKFPEDYANTTKIDDKDVKLAGKDVWFTFTIKSLQKSQTPKLDDNFVKEHFGAYGVKTVDEFHDYAFKQMRISNVINGSWADYVASCEAVSYSSDVKKEQIEKYNENYEQQLSSSYGATLDQYLEACSMSKEQWDEQVESSVLSDMKTRMVVEALAERAGIEMNDKVYKAEAATMAEAMTSTVEDLEKNYGKEEVEYAILYQKVQEYFADNVTVKKGSQPTTEAPTETTSKAAAETTTKADK